MSEMTGRDINYYKELHNRNSDFGTSSIDYANEMELFIEWLKPTTVLDYGCGKGSLSGYLRKKYPNIEVYEYDPAIAGKDVLPKGVSKFDLIINTDVLEHIPEDELSGVLGTISGLSDNVIFGLNHALAEAVLSNGMNAHCTVKSTFWYYNLMSRYFNNLMLLEQTYPWQTLVITFPIDGEVWEKYREIVLKRKFVIDLAIIISPVYKYLRPVFRPLAKRFKEYFFK